MELARVLLEKNPTVLRQARLAYKYARYMDWEQSAEYLTAKTDQTTFVDPERGAGAGAEAVPRRQDLSSRARQLSARELIWSGQGTGGATSRAAPVVDPEHNQDVSTVAWPWLSVIALAAPRKSSGRQAPE